MTTALSIVIGAALLLLGRRLYWLFVAGAGFVIGATLAAELFQGQGVWVQLVIALAAGMIGLLLGLFLQRVAISIAGFVAGGYVLAGVVSSLAAIGTGTYWVLFVIGGIAGAILVAKLFGWALIILSSLMGAGLVVEGVPAAQPWRLLLYVGLAAVGIAVQAGLLRNRGRRSRV